MSIRLHDVYVPAGSAAARGPLFDGLALDIPGDCRVGILGAPKSGKSTLLRLICGTKLPESGVIERDVRTSWPIPLNAYMNGSASVARNIRFIARLYGIRNEEFPKHIAEMVGLEPFLNVTIQKCPKFVKPRLALALGIGLEFDTYLFDGSLAPADKPFREKAVELVTSRMAGRGYILATAAPAEAEKYCDSIYVLEAGKARYFTDKKEGIEYFAKILDAEKRAHSAAKGARQVDEEIEDSDGIGDVDVIGAAIVDEIE